MKNYQITMKAFIVCAFACMVSINTWAQSKSTMDLLMLDGKMKWDVQFPSPQSYTCTISFTKTDIISTVEYNGESGAINTIYYLSAEIPAKFDSTKMGKVEHGKYIVEEAMVKSPEGGKYKETTVFEIIYLSSDSLRLKNLTNSSYIDYKARKF